WRLVLGTAAFSLVAPVGFVALPLAALFIATRPAPGIAWGVAVALAAFGAWTLLPAPGDRLGTLEAAFALWAAVAFAGGNLLAPVGLWRQSVRALLWAGAATLGLATVAWGGIAWSELHWEATRKVKDGYARNFLLPKGLAYPATEGNKKRIAFEADRLAKKRALEREAAQGEAGKLDGVHLTFPVKVGEEDRLYGSVTAGDIQRKL